MKRIAYKVITYYTKTKRPHTFSLEYGCKLKTGCSWNPVQGARHFKDIATEAEIESYYRELQNNKPLIRSYTGLVWNDKKHKDAVRTSYIPNRHQRKHGITEKGL